MEREAWLRLRAIVDEVHRDFSRRPRVRYTDRLILLVYAWAVAHDRPTSWACDPSHWPAGLRPPCLPSQPTMSRRLKSPRLHWLFRLLLERLRGDDPPPEGGPPPPRGLVKVIDAKPLPIGGLGKDPDAGVGFGAGRRFKGYKLYALKDFGAIPAAWEVRPASVAESMEAERLIPALRGFGYLDADAAYDDSGLYDLAMDRGHQMLAPRKRPGTGLGHCYQSEWRLRAITLLEAGPTEPPTGLPALEPLEAPIGRRLYAGRSAIERSFGNLTSFGGGLGPLPAWVRRLGRVAMWVAMKIILAALRFNPGIGLTA